MINDEVDSLVPGNRGDIAHFDVVNYRVQVSAPKGVVLATSGKLVEEKASETEVKYEFIGAALREFTLNGSSKY